MLAFTVAALLMLVVMFKVFGPDRRVCVQCGGWVRHKRGCPEERP